LTAAAQAMLP